MREIGKGLYGWSFAHTVRIDKDDNIWAVDKGSDMVIKFNQAGRVVMVFGRRKESADRRDGPWEHVESAAAAHVDGLFRQPTDVAWDSDGNIYISDGYVNSRVAKFDRNGDWVKSWGERGHGPGQFSTAARHRRRPQRTTSTSAIVATGASRCSIADGKFLRMFTIDVPPDSGHPRRQRQHADRRSAGRRDRRAELDLHHAGSQPGDVRRREHLSRDASSRCRSTARCSASSAGPGGS